jgi:DNA excision repair protein ERCC-5
MGVTGLWTVLQPCARPVKIETLNRKRLAVDASIWIYQFLKAVRDKEGNALRNSHVVGFFRRICKLLFFGIKPVFVFDGGAPALKRATITGRKKRREGRREDAVRTAGKLLALQMQRRAEEEEQRRQDEATRTIAEDDEEPLPENLVYVEELQMTERERLANRKFKKMDQYHLPDLGVNLTEMGQPNDPRIMSMEELQEYARQFEQGEDINVYDFSKIDFESPFFISLPASDRYNILNAARLRSRLRMGYSKEQLDSMFPDRMAFSRFQIERVRERNELTQRLMNINGMNEDGMFGVNGTSRVAGEKGREYVLVKNDGVEGGWALGVVSGNKDEGKKSQPIDVDGPDRMMEDDQDEDWEDADEFEDVPIEGLNRLPKRPQPAIGSASDIIARDLERRRTLYKYRKGPIPRRRRGAIEPQDPNSLFVQDDSDEEWEDVGISGNANIPQEVVEVHDEEEEELQRAIALSLRNPEDVAQEIDEDDDYREVFEQQRVEEPKPFAHGTGQAIAHMANNRSGKAAPKPFVEEDEDEVVMDLQSALLESRHSKHVSLRPQQTVSSDVTIETEEDHATQVAKAAGFDGPLPFEKLDLGTSLLGKKKMQKLQEDASGGFEREDKSAQKKQAEPVPPWFQGNLEDDLSKLRAQELEDSERDRQAQADEENFHFEPSTRLRNQEACDIIDLDADEQMKEERYVIEIESDDEEDYKNQDEEAVLDSSLHMDDPAQSVKVVPPKPLSVNAVEGSPRTKIRNLGDQNSDANDEELLEWSDSDHEDAAQATKDNAQPGGGDVQPNPQLTASPQLENQEFEDFDMAPRPKAQLTAAEPESPRIDLENPSVPLSGVVAHATSIVEDFNEEEFYSDPEDEELLRQLIAEEEEHARFASTLNNRSVTQNIAEYERELKQLRNQQKRDRRDADEVTQTMITECQQLLTLFGLPYITAPMEAEAQCAELVRLGLVDGIVTDDSDIFLFGGTRVYKNMFNQAKFVECYLESDLESGFGLTRKRLISIAQLLGSDYTEGLPGIGPVTAVEMISEFDDLNNFKEWWGEVQMGRRRQEDDAGSGFKKKFRRNATKLFLPPSFPDPRVDEAYLHPEVDSDPSQFVWGVPDLDALRAFLMSTIGWSAERTDEILVPVIRDMNRKEAEGTQSNITAFFEGGVGAGAFAPRRRQEGGSKRLESALHKIGERARREIADGEVEAGTSTNSPTITNGNKVKDRQKPSKRSKPSEDGRNSDSDDDEEYAEPRKKQRKARETKARNTGQQRHEAIRK